MPAMVRPGNMKETSQGKARLSYYCNEVSKWILHKGSGTLGQPQQ